VTDKAVEKEALTASAAESQPKADENKKKAPNYKIPEMESSSWGDKYKRPIFNFNEHVTVNYALNTFIAATFAFFAEKHILNDSYKKGLANLLKTTQGSPAYKAANYAVSAALLTMGGTSLLPFMKHAEENRQEYQYKLSKMLDKTQKTLGFSTEDTERNLADYEVIEKIAHSKNCKEDCGIGEEEIKRLEGKYHFAFQEDGAIKFEKVHKSWGEMFKARGTAILASMATGAMLGASKGKPAAGVSEEQLHALEEAGDFGNKGYGFIETKLVKPLSNVLQKVPGFKTIIDKPMHYSKLLLEDAILTVVSAVTFAFVSKGEAHTQQLDTNRDGWVSTEEAKEFKNKSPNAKIGHDVQVEEIIRPTSNRHSHKEAAPAEVAAEPHKESHVEKHASHAPAHSHVEKHAKDHAGKEHAEHSHTKSVQPMPAAHTQAHKPTPSAHTEKLNVQRQNAQETPAAIAP
jgi:hypothetical protein